MALKDPQFRSSGDPMEGYDAEELEELEADVKEMAKKVRHYRTTLPDQLKATFTSILSSQRPPFLEFVSGSEPEASGEPKPGQSRVLLAQGDHETSEKIQLLKQNISSNVSTIPVLLKRLNECMSMVDKLDLYNGIMHPAFKRRRTS
ncbi:uncharacterized protein LOC117932395 isoform X2 [Vitis riparia]|uniref:uncharacterized protein LOC117932395 isoform X2 n=1 Tax=Vitis riparia TaxID=96939 RepID=UPI00155AD53C|nr:uncharacterized protein LOC117932395 isoform X2 [Vitis riparia]